ncbi:hypothetical protein ACE1SV_00350 [Streptomyces sennicomposti]
MQGFGLARADPVQGLDRQRREPRLGLVGVDREDAAGRGDLGGGGGGDRDGRPMPTRTSTPRRDRARIRSTSPSLQAPVP